LKDRGVSLAFAPRPARATLEREAGNTNRDRSEIGAGGNPSGRQPERLVRVAAERRVERFLADFGVPRGRRRELVVQSCIARATEEWREHPGRDLGALAFAQAEETLAQWFRAVLGAETIAQDPPLLVGRAAVEICEAAGSWPGTLSTCDRLPPAASEALQRAGVSPTPSEMQGTMSAQVLEPWSLKDLATSLQAFALRLTRGISGGTAATS
jgi:hypothetical protein